MEFKASAKYIRVSPQKARVVIDAVRPLPLPKALVHLKHMNKKSAKLIQVVIQSAISNANERKSIPVENLQIKLLCVDEGPAFKRWRPVSRGAAHEYKKRTSHITVILETKNEVVRARLSSGRKKTAREEKALKEQINNKKNTNIKPNMKKTKNIKNFIKKVSKKRKVSRGT